MCMFGVLKIPFRNPFPNRIVVSLGFPEDCREMEEISLLMEGNEKQVIFTIFNKKI